MQMQILTQLLASSRCTMIVVLQIDRALEDHMITLCRLTVPYIQVICPFVPRVRVRVRGLGFGMN